LKLAPHAVHQIANEEEKEVEEKGEKNKQKKISDLKRGRKTHNIQIVTLFDCCLVVVFFFLVLFFQDQNGIGIHRTIQPRN
jgi:type III secretory pathway component EscU